MGQALQREWRRALEAAKAEGRSFRAFSSHAFGEIVCPAGVHKQKIFSTGQHTENVARDTYTLVMEKCGHGNSATANVHTAEIELTKADRLTSAAETLLKRGDGEARIEELLDNADSLVDQVAVGKQFDDLVTRKQELTEDVDPDLRADPPRSLLDQAASRVRHVVKLLAGVPTRQPERVDLMERAESVRSRIAGCRRRLASTSGGVLETSWHLPT